MERLPEDHQCGPYCLRACTLDVRPEFEQDQGPENREGYLVQGGRLALRGGVNYVNLLSLGYWNQGAFLNHQGGNGGQELEQQPAEEPAEEPAGEPTGEPAEEPPEEPGLVAAVAQGQQQQDPPRRRRPHRKFTAMQLQELEELFQETEYPDLFTRYVAGSGGAGSRWVWAHFQPPLSLCRDCSFPSKATKSTYTPGWGWG